METLESVGVEEEVRVEAQGKLLMFRIVFEEGAKKATIRNSRQVQFSPDTVSQKIMAVLDDWSVSPKLAFGASVVVVGAIATSVLLKKRRTS